jgi:hypothetical protein
MSNPQHNLIANLSRAFREAIENCDKSKLPCSFAKFPKGSCGDVAPLLGKFLIDHGLGESTYMLGKRGKWSHAWLQFDNLIVDITADQFDDQSKSVIVTTNSEWHDQFKGQAQYSADYRIFGLDSPAGIILDSAYFVLLSTMDKSYLPPSPGPT